MQSMPDELKRLTISYLDPTAKMRCALSSRSLWQRVEECKLLTTTDSLENICKQSSKILKHYIRICTSNLYPSPVGMVCCGKAHTIIHISGQLFGKGSNSNYQLGPKQRGYYREFALIETSKRVAKCSAGLWHTLMLHDDNTASSCGKNRFNQCIRRSGSVQEPLAPIERLRCKDIHAADNYSIIVLEDGNVVGFGKSKAQCVKRSKARTTIAHPRHNQAPDGLNNIISIGGNKNCVVVQDNKNKIYAWGKLGTTKRITECPKYLDTIAI